MAATGVGLGLLAVVVLRQVAPGAAARPADPRPAPRAVAPRDPRPAPAAVPERNVFAYAAEPRPEREAAARPLIQAPTPLPPPEPLAVEPSVDPMAPRLVGLVRRGGALRGVISVEGEVLVVKIGDRAGPYTVVSIDEDRGVQLRDTIGAVTTLAPPPS